MLGLIEKLRTRKIFQWLLAYLAAGWLILQVGAILADTFAWPSLAMRILTVMLAIGVIVTAVIAWYHGERGRQRITGIELGMLTVLLVIAGAAVALVSGFRGRDDAVDFVAEEASVAVMPFVDMSEGRNQEYFGDGITEEILNVVAKLPGLRVPARTSSFSFKGKNLPVSEIAQQLKVAYVLEGSVRRSGEKVRITAQLIDARTDQHTWSESYDRNVDDIFKVQEEIARSIARALQLRIQPKSNVRLVGATTNNSVAHDLYLKGLSHWHSRHQAELPLALEFFRAAVREDPGFAPAHAGLALTHAVLPQYIADEYDYRRSAEEGKRAAARALELDPRSAQAHAALGQIAQELEWDWDAARTHLEQALQLDQAYATAHQWRAELQVALGNFAAALAAIDRALQLDPLSSVMQNIRGLVLVELGSNEEALKQFRKILERDPAFPARNNLVGTLIRLRRHDEALALVGDDQNARALIIGLRDQATSPALLRQLGDANLRSSLSKAQLAFLYAHIGQRDSALTVLNRAAAEWETQLAYVVHSGWSTPLRSDPRFQQFREKVRLK